MGINSPLPEELINPVMGVSYNRSAGLALDADLVVLVIDVGVLEVELLRLTFAMRREVSQTRV